MDPYTEKTRIWLDERFKKCTEDGVYLAHQPIYGFRKNHYEPPYAFRLIPTYQIMRALSRLKFDSLLDVGGAEGYKAYIAKELFNVRVENSDLSQEACRRAGEIFHLKSTPVDIHELPFNDNEFDVVLCSETLEHVADLDKALNEILRVAKKAAVLTVPYDDRQVIDMNLREKIPHGHIRAFDLKSFDFLKSRGYIVIHKRMLSKTLLYYSNLVEEASPKEYYKGAKFPQIFYDIYNVCISPLIEIFGAEMLAFFIALDDFICKFTCSYSGMCFTILKDKCCYGKRIKKVFIRQIMNFKVPYHYLIPPQKSPGFLAGGLDFA